MSINDLVKRDQELRMRRFSMSVITYVIVILAVFLITRLGLGEMNNGQWAMMMGMILFGVIIFFALFYTNTNLHFSEPSLTREQIVYAAICGLVPLYSLPEARPIILLFFMVIFSYGMLILNIRQYLTLTMWVLAVYGALLGFEYFQEPNGFNIQYQLFLFILFGILLTWFAFFGGFVSNLRLRLRQQKKEILESHEALKVEVEERKRSQMEKDDLIVELKDALRTVNTLSGLLPICASCKSIRDDKGYWNKIEAYIKNHTKAEFSHGICPKCAEDYFPNQKNKIQS